MSKTTTPKRSKTKARPAKPARVILKPRRGKRSHQSTDATSADTPAAAAETQGAAAGGATSAKPRSGLDAAVEVLREVGEPMNAQDMVKRMLDQGLWTTAGKTPAATIYAAIIREIKAKGSDARFQKVDRGRFAAVG